MTTRRRCRWFRYVRHADALAYWRAGWAFAADLGRIHGHWSVLMEWTGNGKPREPAI